MRKPHCPLALALAAVTVGCQSSAERARIEMQSVYRSAKTLDEQMKAGAGLTELIRLQGNLATELGIVHDRMRVNSRLGQALGPSYVAYQATLQSYSLVVDILEYHDTMERCIAPRYEPPDAATFKRMSPMLQYTEGLAGVEFMGRVWKCGGRFSHVADSLRERADRLGMNCPGLDLDSGCPAAFAEAKLASAEKLLVGR
jgi:hypothetical protein